MDSREARFVGAVVQAEDGTVETVNPAVSGWRFTTKDHPIDGYPLALAVGAYHGGQFGRTSFPAANFARARLALAAVRTGADAASVEVTAGLEFDHFLQHEYRMKLVDNAHCGGLIACWETAPAHVGTTVLRIGWEGVSATDDDVVRVRTRPVIGKYNEHLLPFLKQMDALWAAGEASTPVDEAFLSGRSTPFAASSEKTPMLHVGVPWMSRYHEQVYSFDLTNLHLAVAAVKGLVTPPPPPDPDPPESTE